MASTRDRNQPGNYKCEQIAKERAFDYLIYENSQNGKPIQSLFPGDGLLTGRMVPTELSRNSCDIESFLYGIGTNNLVTPQEKPIAEIRSLQSLNIIERLPVIMPDPLVIEPNQRPRPLK
jgi:hypothetical protein